MSWKRNAEVRPLGWEACRCLGRGSGERRRKSMELAEHASGGFGFGSWFIVRRHPGVVATKVSTRGSESAKVPHGADARWAQVRLGHTRSKDHLLSVEI